MRVIKIHDIDIHYNIEDNGRKKILFIHGYESSHNFIRELYDAKRDYDIISLDLPGYGKSEYHEYVTVELYATIMREFIKQLKLNDLVIVGHSMGGAISMFISDMEEVKQVVLVNPLNPYVLESARNYFHVKDFFKTVKEHNSKKNLSQKIDNLRNFSHHYRDFNKKMVREEFFNEDWQGNDLYYQYVKGAPKTTIISSDKDIVVLPESLKKISKNLRIPLIVMKDSEHSAINKDPKQFNKILESLIK